MNISNAEFKNSMGTIRTDLPINNHVGLIKSASTSTCCANENSSHSQIQRKSVNFNKYPIKDDFYNKRFVIEPSSYLEKSLHEKGVKNTQIRFRCNDVKHFSDCDIDRVSNPQEKFSKYFSSKENENRREFRTHSGLDKILVNEENNNSVINFAVVNDIKANIHQRMDAIKNVSEHDIDDTNCISIVSSNSAGVCAGTDSSQSSDSPCNKLSLVNISDGKYSNEVPFSSEHLLDSQNEKNQKSGDSVVTEENSPEDEEILNIKALDKSEPEVCSVEKTSRDDIVIESGPEKMEFHIESSPESIERKERNIDKPFRRSSSLKIHKESTSTSAQKKIVRFADVLGLDLTDVRTFLDELPLVPKSAYRELEDEDVALSESPPKTFGPPVVSGSKSLVPTFRPPVSTPDFLEKIRDNYVCLETASVFNAPVCHISGTVRVRNLDFYKSVYVRYTSDSWKTFSEVQASYVPDSCDGFSDKFAFVIYIYTVAIGQRIELAVRYHCCGSIYWDNNSGNNYVFQCFPATPSMPSYFQSFSPSGEHCSSFY